MKYQVITCMNEAIFAATGQRMERGVLSNWPAECGYYAFWEDQQLDEDRELAAFRERNGRREVKVRWRDDSLKWAWKVFAMCKAGLSLLHADVLVWLDADVDTFAPISEEQLDEWMPDGKWVTYLGREGGYTETGFLMFRVREMRGFFKHWLGLYTSDAIFERDWVGDGATFDRAREEVVPEEHWNNLSPWGKQWDHVFINSELGRYMDHMKGQRKGQGKSRTGDLLPRAPKEMVARLS